MLRIWQKRLLDNNKPEIYEFAEAGAHTLDLGVGIWEISLVGGGGGGAGAMSTIFDLVGWADGGVGGTLRVRIKVPTKKTITINVADSSISRYFGAAHGSAEQGKDTTITGLDDVVLVAGGGTSGSILQSEFQPVPGIIGTNTATGSNLISIIENNPRTIVSKSGRTQRTTSQTVNSNWPEDTSCGAGGAVYPRVSPRLIDGGVGFVRLIKIN